MVYIHLTYIDIYITRSVTRSVTHSVTGSSMLRHRLIHAPSPAHPRSVTGSSTLRHRLIYALSPALPSSALALPCLATGFVTRGVAEAMTITEEVLCRASVSCLRFVMPSHHPFSFPFHHFCFHFFQICTRKTNPLDIKMMIKKEE